MKILVTGGAGYIGSVTVKLLQKKGYDIIVLDNLHQGHKDSVTAEIVIADLLDKKDLFQKLDKYQFDAVIHFAAYTLAGESMQAPELYFKNNIIGGIHLLEFMREKKIPSIVFSSSCAIYGTPEKVPVTENESKKPESVYGESKLAVEKILYWYDQIYGIKHINLRYFNACGAALDGSSGEQHNPETHIIPIAVRCALEGKPFQLFGKDYPTPDGTCIRDYIHIEDLASAHLLALEKLQEKHKSNYFNLGTGKGYSNLEILTMVKKVSGRDFPVLTMTRRAGDPAIIYADNTKSKKELGFNPQYSDLETIIKTVWEWEKKKNKN